MKYALISPVEPRELGYRVADVANAEFDIALPLFWVECNDEISADAYWYNPEDGSFAKMPEPEPQSTTQPTVNGAQSL